MTGYELAKHVRSGEQGTSRRLPILGITASTAPEELRKCRDAGMDECLVKPTRLASLREHLHRWWMTESSASEPEAQARLPIDPESENEDDLDLGAMAQLWGNEATVKALLDAFVSSFRDDLAALQPLLDRGTVEHLREWHHRVMGAASVLQYRSMVDALEKFRRNLQSMSQAERREDELALIARCK